VGLRPWGYFLSRETSELLFWIGRIYETVVTYVAKSFQEMENRKENLFVKYLGFYVLTLYSQGIILHMNDCSTVQCSTREVIIWQIKYNWPIDVTAK